MSVLRFEQEWTKVHPEKPYMLRLMRDALGTDCVEWEDLTTSNLSSVADYMDDAISQNSKFTYCAELKAFLNRYKDDGIVPCKEPSKVLKAKREPSQHIALSEEEVMLWDAYHPWNDCEMDAKIIFMRGCLTGARYSDCIRLTVDNVRDGVLTYVSQKTKTEVKQPAHHLLMKYLEQQPSKERKPKVLNEAIERICKRLGFNEEVTLYVRGKLRKGPKYEFIRLHSSRRSFVTNLALRNVAVPVIGTLAGQKSPATTSRYICIGLSNLNDDAMDFFRE